jgi:hypothetical protein
LSTPVQSPAKSATGSSLGLETPESYNRKRQEAIAATMNADRLQRLAMEKEVETDRLAMAALLDNDTDMGTIDDRPDNIGTTIDESMISAYDNNDDDETDSVIAAQYNFHNDEEDTADVSMSTPTMTGNVNDIDNTHPGDRGPPGPCG